jgi:hypothetical protein
MYVVVGYTAATPGSANPTGAPSFTSASSGAGSVSWSNPGNAQTTNSSYATAVLTTSNRTSQYLEQQGGFNIPAGATVTGIQVDVRRSATVANVLRDEVAQLIKGGSLAGNNQTGGGSYNIGTTDSTVTFGGAGNLWGTTWTPAQINAGTFGFAYEMYHSNSGGSATARVDSIIITVYYTTPSGGTSANLAPSTLSSTAGWNPNTGSDVSAVTVNDAGAYIVPGPQQESFGFANSGVPAGSTITSVTVHAVALGSGSTLQLMEENAGGTQILEPTTHALTAAYVDYSYTFPNMPSGAAWTLAEVNAWTTKFGVVNVSGNSARVTQMYVVVGYTAVGGVACQLGMDLSWNGGATWTTPEKTQTLTGTEATYTLGASNDDWTNSHTWAPADFSDANFRARVHAIDPGAACDNAAVDHLDWLQMKVHYTLNVDPIEEALKAADIAKKGPDGIAGNADDTDIFTIHFGADPGPYQGQKLMANLATGASAVTYNGITHQNGSVAQAGGVVTSDTGYIQPSAVSTPSQWTNPANAFTSDNVYATDAVNGHQQGYTTFGFTIPPTATITGVALSVEAKSSDSSGCQVGAELSSNNGTSFTTSGTNAGVTGSDVAYTLGGSASLWGRAWVPADFNNGSFVVRLQNIDPGNACVNGSTLSTDQIRARVYYSANTENSDGDNFFIAPSSADMQSIFNFIGNQVCPAAVNLTSIPPPTTGTLLVMTTVTNNNGGGAVASAFTANVSAVSPSQSSFAGSTSGVSVTVGPGSYSVTEGAVSGYNEILGATCSGTIVAGETRVCVLTNDDIPPPPPPPNFSVNVGSWQEVP